MDKNACLDEKSLLKALENTGVHYFTYHVRERTVVMPERTCEKYGCIPICENMPYSYAEQFVFEADRPIFIDVYDKIHNGEDCASATVRTKNGENWCTITLTVTERAENGEPLTAIGVSEDMSLAKKREMNYGKLLGALSEVFSLRCTVNVQEDTYELIEEELKGPDGVVEISPAPKKGAFSENTRRNASLFVHPEDHTEYLGKLSADYIAFHLGRRNRSFTLEYRRLSKGGAYRWIRGTVLLIDTDKDGSVRNVIYTEQFIDAEKEEKALLESSLSLMRDTYYRIGCIDLNRNSMRTISISESERGEASLFRENFGRAIRGFAKNYVLEEYREKFLNVMVPEKITELFDGGAEYIDITYRRLESGTPKWVRTELVPLKGYSPENRRVMWYVKNISEEKALEDKLSQKLIRMNTDVNLRLTTILDGISGGFAICLDDEKFTFYYVSESAAKLFGYSVEEFTDVTGNSAIENVYPDDRESVLKTLRSSADDGSYFVKYRVRCRDGSIKWVTDTGKKVTAEDGRVLYYNLYQDVTNLEKRTNDLSDALTVLDRLMQSLSCGILAYRLPGREVLAFNDEARRLFGYTGENISDDINNLLYSNISQEDSEAIRREVRKLKKPGDVASYEFRLHNKNGGVFTIQAKSALLEFEDGSLFVLSSMTDITEKSELYDIIREERTRFRDALLANCEYAYSFDVTQGMITQEFVTKHGVNLLRELGLSVPVPFDTMIEKWVSNFKPKLLNSETVENMSRVEMLRRFAADDRRTETEYFSPVTNIYTRVTALLSRSERNGHIMATIIAVDTTETRQREEIAKKALQEAYDAAKRANSAKSDFLSRMSHDIRTPMNAIIGMTAIAGTHIDDRERVLDCLSKITVSSSHLLSLINEVLDMSKIESGKVDLCEEEFNLSDLIDTLISMVRSDVKAKNLNFNVQINDIVHEKVIGDSLRIQQSFLNLMSNAVKYTPEGGSINLIISEKPMHSAKVGRYEFIFQDTGIGMTQEFVEHIFEPFARADDSRVSKIEGTGLGLAITDNLVRMMNGTINVESKLGKGTKFTVTISLKLQDDEDLSFEEFAELPVLIADDDEVTCESACHILDEMGMKGEWVLNGKDAVDKVVRRHNDGQDYFAVILDWKMPGMDGITATKEICRLVGHSVTIIIISAYDWSDIELEARAAGADAFIGKPLFKSRLAHLFHDMISGGEEARKKSPTADLSQEDFTGSRVLLVEDNELNAEIAKELLEMMNVEVECAENGRIAVDMFSASEPGYYQMIFMDVQMPVMNGNEAARAIRALSRRDAKGIPIVAMTANAFSEDVQTALAAGMNEHIAKPLDLKAFVKTLKKWLGAQNY